MYKLYLYLLKRDKTFMNIIGTLHSSKQIRAARLMNLEMINFSTDDRKKVGNIIHEHRHEWEPWIETADTYKELIHNLTKRGIVSPSSNSCILDLGEYELSKPAILSLNKIMIRRSS
jgi:hypothetical protein